MMHDNAAEMTPSNCLRAIAERNARLNKVECDTPRPPNPALGACLEEAKQCICGERQDSYGNPEDSFDIIAKFWSAYIATPLAPIDVANMMILFKTARCLGQKPGRDNYVDIAGYASIAADRLMKP